eukprot:TRINITY_DN17122_c0_g1_i1.p1 TRINITY_DN17122_c0_g1~~TRINITY_DN17122_c0_g1_i1.p1  ORF type:complete len:102 (+),score=2.43 TRINITY_DN17122_c0_g1_i1:168-473(+)
MDHLRDIGIKFQDEEYVFCYSKKEFEMLRPWIESMPEAKNTHFPSTESRESNDARVRKLMKTTLLEPKMRQEDHTSRGSQNFNMKSGIQSTSPELCANNQS